MRYQQATDEVLMQRTAEDDSAAYEELYNRYWQPLYIFAYRKLRHVEEAKDAVQDVFIRLWQRRHTLHVNTSLRTYLFAAVRYEVLRKISDALKAAITPANLEQLPVMEAARAIDAVREKELLRELHLAVEQLPVKMKEIYILSRNNHKPVAAIASELRLSEQTVKNQLSRALTRLRAYLKETAF